MVMKLHFEMQKKKKGKKRTVSRKSVVPYCYYHAHMANSGWLSNHDQTLAHFMNRFRSTLTYNWAALIKVSYCHQRITTHM